MDGCHECGAAERDGRTCRQQWDELLALEFSDARAGSVHFLTVACYQLQHPQAFPLHPEARRWLEDALGGVVLQGRPISTVRDAMQRRYDGSRSVVGPPSASAVPQRWSRTVADVGAPDAERHAERVREWAATVYADLAGSAADGGEDR